MLINAIFIYFIGVIVTATDHNININKTVEELENEKKYLLKEINAAIDDSVKSLKQVNDSDSLVGLKYMEELKEHMKRAHPTVQYVNSTEANEPFAFNGENRRRLKDLLDPNKWRDKKTTVKDIFDFESILKPPKKKHSTSNWKDVLEIRQKIQKQLDAWILEREKEKARLEKKRHEKKRLKLSGVYEKCPRFGYQGRKKKNSIDKVKAPHCKKCKGDKKKDNKTDDRPAKIKRPQSKKLKYPCCRKCCKKSYLGCL